MWLCFITLMFCFYCYHCLLALRFALTRKTKQLRACNSHRLILKSQKSRCLDTRPINWQLLGFQVQYMQPMDLGNLIE